MGQLAHRNQVFDPDRIPVGTMKDIINAVKNRTLTGEEVHTMALFDP